MTEFPDDPDLPPYLRIAEVLEPEQVPLQVQLLTLEMASLHTRLTMVARTLVLLGETLAPPRWTEPDETSDERSGLDPERDE